VLRDGKRGVFAAIREFPLSESSLSSIPRDIVVESMTIIVRSEEMAQKWRSWIEAARAPIDNVVPTVECRCSCRCPCSKQSD
jgi:hypothetical protein